MFSAYSADPDAGKKAPMTDDEILAEFRDADALLEGHFILSSGLRSPRYLQCARLLMDPKRAERMALALAANWGHATEPVPVEAFAVADAILRTPAGTPGGPPGSGLPDKPGLGIDDIVARDEPPGLSDPAARGAG